MVAVRADSLVSRDHTAFLEGSSPIAKFPDFIRIVCSASRGLKQIKQQVRIISAWGEWAGRLGGGRAGFSEESRVTRRAKRIGAGAGK